MWKIFSIIWISRQLLKCTRCNSTYALGQAAHEQRIGLGVECPIYIVTEGNIQGENISSFYRYAVYLLDQF